MRLLAPRQCPRKLHGGRFQAPLNSLPRIGKHNQKMAAKLTDRGSEGLSALPVRNTFLACDVALIPFFAPTKTCSPEDFVRIAAVLRAAVLHVRGGARECAQNPGGRKHQAHRQTSGGRNPDYGHNDNGSTSAIRRKGAFGTAGDFNTPKNDVPADHYSDSWYHSLKCLGGAV